MKKLIVLFFVLISATTAFACMGKENNNYSLTSQSTISSSKESESIKSEETSISSTSSKISFSSLEQSSGSSVKPSSSSNINLSSDTNVVVNKVCGQSVTSSKVILTEKQYKELANATDVKSKLTFSIPKGATFVASYSEQASKILLDITAEDGTKASKEIEVFVEDLFGYYANNLGQDNGFIWSNSNLGYTANYENASSVESGLYLNNSILSNYYYASMQVTLSNLTENATFVLTARVSDSMRVRYIIKATSSTQIEIGSDYNDGYKDLDYKTHVSAFTYSSPLNIGFIVNKTEVAMLYNNEIVYHRGLEGLSTSQMVVSTTQSLGVKINDIVIDNVQSQVENKYVTYTKDYQDDLVGNTIGHTNNLDKCEQDLQNKTVSINMANTTLNAPMVSFRNSGNPVAGYSFAVTGNIRVKTVSGKSGHIVFMLYHNDNNSLSYFINRNDSPNNSCYYRINDNGTWSPSATTNTMCPNTQNILTNGLDWNATFHFIYLQGKTSLYLEGKHIMTYEKDWGYANAILGVPQNAEVFYSDLYSTTNSEKVSQILNELQAPKNISFGTYGDNKGSSSHFANNSSLGGFATQITSGKTYFDAGVYLNGEILSDKYSTQTQIEIPTLIANGELVFSAYSRDNKQIRYIVRAISNSQIEIATDYRDDSQYLDYKVIVPAFSYTGAISVGFVVNGNHVAMLYNRQVVYHRALENFEKNQFVIASANSMQAVLKNIEIQNNQIHVENLYNTIMASYKDDLVGNTIGSTNNLDKCEQDLQNGTVRINMANTTLNAPMVSFMSNGNPIAGYSFAITGKINASTVSGKSGHITFMCYSDNNNWSRFIINRVDGNNSCYYRYKDAGVAIPSSDNTKSTYANNILTSGLNWVADFTFIYDSGYVALYVENKLMMQLQTNWGIANAVLEIPQNVDITYSNLVATTNPLKVEEIRKQTEQTSVLASAFTENTVWTVNQNLSFIKNDYAYNKASVAVNGNELISNAFYLKANISVIEPNSYGQAEILIWNESYKGFRYVLEYLPDGTYQIFTQEVDGNTQSNWALVASKVKRELNMGIAVVNGKITFFVDNVKMHEYSSSNTFKLYLGGEKCVVRVKNVEINTEKQQVENLVIGLKEDAYVSNYLSRARSIASSYAGEPTGQTLLMGSSSIDLWKERTDSNGNLVAGYLADLHDLPDNDNDGLPDVLNVGIGGTTYKDWLSFYDILVKPFLPAPKIVLYCGANDVYGGGSAEDTFANYKKLVDKILADSPTSTIYYVRTNPSKTLYGTNGSGAVWQRLTAYENMVSELAKTTSNLVVIDMVNELKDDNGPKASLWDADGTHLNREGYAVWARYVRDAMGLN